MYSSQPLKVAKVNRLKLVNMDFNFYQHMPGTRHRRSQDVPGNAGATGYSSCKKSMDELEGDLKGGQQDAGQEAIANASGDAVDPDTTFSVETTTKIIEAGQEEEPTEETILRCPTTQCWEYEPETQACVLKEECTDVQCTHDTVIATDN